MADDMFVDPLDGLSWQAVEFIADTDRLLRETSVMGINCFYADLPERYAKHVKYVRSDDVWAAEYKKFCEGARRYGMIALDTESILDTE